MFVSWTIPAFTIATDCPASNYLAHLIFVTPKQFAIKVTIGDKNCFAVHFVLFRTGTVVVLVLFVLHRKMRIGSTIFWGLLLRRGVSDLSANEGH